MKTRSLMAFAGQFGYELDLLKLGAIENIEVKRFISIHREIESIVRTGDMYRLLSPFNSGICSWSFVSEQATSAVVFVFNTDYYESVWNYPRIILQGLDPEAIYSVSQLDLPIPLKLSGKTLMHAGLVVNFNGDAQSIMYTLQRL